LPKLPYGPKYTDTIRVRGIVRPHADNVVEGDLLDRIQEAERKVEDFLVACGFDLANLTSDEEDHARDLSTYHAVILLAPSLAVTETFKLALEEGFRRLVEDIEKSFASRKKLTVQKVRAQLREIDEEATAL